MNQEPRKLKVSHFAMIGSFEGRYSIPELDKDDRNSIPVSGRKATRTNRGRTNNVNAGAEIGE